jgi:hypothetical protein
MAQVREVGVIEQVTEDRLGIAEHAVAGERLVQHDITAEGSASPEGDPFGVHSPPGSSGVALDSREIRQAHTPIVGQTF